MSEELENLSRAITDATNYYDNADFDEKIATGDRFWKRAVEICDQMNKLAEELERMEHQWELNFEYGEEDDWYGAE